MGGGDTDSSDMEEDRESGKSSQDEMSQSIEEREIDSEEFTEDNSKDDAT